MSSPDPDTDQLLDLCRQGVTTARDPLFERHRDRLRRMVQARLDPRLAKRLDSSDVIQDVLAKASRQLPDYLLTRPLPFYPWLRQIAFDRLVELHRRHVQAGRRSITRESPIEMPFPDDSVAELARRLVSRDGVPLVRVVREELIARVRVAVDALPTGDRELIILRHIEQLPMSQVAAILGSTEGAVRTRHFRVLRRLHLALTEGDEP